MDINLIILIISIICLVLYLFLKNPYTYSQGCGGAFNWLFTYKTDQPSHGNYSYAPNGIIKAGTEFNGAWGITKEEAQTYISQEHQRNGTPLPPPIVTRKVRYIETSYYWPIIFFGIMIFVSALQVVFSQETVINILNGVAIIVALGVIYQIVMSFKTKMECDAKLADMYARRKERVR